MTFQKEVDNWMRRCFAHAIVESKTERNQRFIEEALELVQACGMTKGHVHDLVDYVFGRDVGDIPQEIGGVMITLAALCTTQGFDMEFRGAEELARCHGRMDAIRAKQLLKPRFE